MAPPAGVYFAAFVSRFEMTCAQTRRVRVDRQARRNVDGQHVSAILEQGARDLDGIPDDLGEFGERHVQLDLAARDPGHVEQVVDEAGQVHDLALDDRPLALGDRSRPAAS